MDSSEIASLVLAKGFWESDEPAVFFPPHLEQEGTRLLKSLRESEWAPRAVVFASSGTTGNPKWILHTKETLLASARMVNEHVGTAPQDRWLLALPGFHVGGFGVCARAFEAGHERISCLEQWSPARFRECLETDDSTLTSLVPTQVHDLVKNGQRAPSGLRAVIVGGGRLESSLGQQARALGWPVLQSYGMTEAGSQVATVALENLSHEFENNSLEVLKGWETRASPTGILELRGDPLFQGYLVPEGGQLRLLSPKADGWFMTNDLLGKGGGEKFLSIRGRADRQVKVRGELVDLDALEVSLRERLLEGESCHVIALPDERVGYRLVPVIASRRGAETGRAVADLNASLPKFARMEKAEVLSELPRTALGKVDFPRLAALLHVSATSRLPKL